MLTFPGLHHGNQSSAMMIIKGNEEQPPGTTAFTTEAPSRRGLGRSGFKELGGSGLPDGTASLSPVHRSLSLTSDHFPSHLLLRSSSGQVNENFGTPPRGLGTVQHPAPPARAPRLSSRTGAEHRWAVTRG